VTLWAIDLDGVMWRGAAPIPGSADAVRTLLHRGDRVVFCTNHAMSPASKVARLRAMDVPECPVITSADAVVDACAGTASVLVLGDATLVQYLRELGLPITDVRDLPDGAPVGPVDAVVVGALEDWDRSRIGMAADAVRAGARFLATNDDATFPVTGPAGPRLLPGNGSLVAAVATAGGRRAVVTGKPHPPMAEVIVRHHGPVDVVVGDKPETDGGLAVTLGARFGLVLSGVTAPEHLPVEPAPWRVGADLAALVAQPL
jgi:4-nitrophenyl phosphatase